MHLTPNCVSTGTLHGTFDWAGLYRGFSISGGPYVLCAGGGAGALFRVCLTKQAPRVHPDVWLPIRDFDVPQDADAVREALQATLEAMIERRPVFVGCTGGYGRTGLFLALLTKVAGTRHPVAHVRHHYHRRAVETERQERYVAEFDVRPLRFWLLRRSVLRCVRQIARRWRPTA